MRLEIPLSSNSANNLFHLFTFLGRAAVKQEKDEEKHEEKEEESTSKAEARSKLNQALENVEEDLEKEKELQAESSESEEEEEEEEEEIIPAKKTKVKAEKDDSPVVKEQKVPRPIKQAQQASYIMKLFDRSVNLAKFTEETPLYPLCRAWMSNAPRQLTSIKVEKSSEPTVHPFEEGDVIEMPKIRIRKGGKPLVQRKEVKIDHDELDKSIDSEIWTKEKLLEFHRGRWEGERQKQIDNSRNFEEKHFAANLELLESLFKGNEE